MSVDWGHCTVIGLGSVVCLTTDIISGSQVFVAAVDSRIHWSLCDHKDPLCKQKCEGHTHPLALRKRKDLPDSGGRGWTRPIVVDLMMIPTQWVVVDSLRPPRRDEHVARSAIKDAAPTFSRKSLHEPWSSKRETVGWLDTGNHGQHCRRRVWSKHRQGMNWRN